MMTSITALPRMLRLGTDGCREAVSVLEQFGLSRPLIVTDAFMMRQGLIGQF